MVQILLDSPYVLFVFVHQLLGLPLLGGEQFKVLPVFSELLRCLRQLETQLSVLLPCVVQSTLQLFHVAVEALLIVLLQRQIDLDFLRLDH